MNSIKAYLYTGLGLLVTALAIAVKVLTGRNSRLTRKLETSEAKVHHAKTVMLKDKQIELEHDVRTEKLADDVKNKKTSSELENPNEW